MTKDQVINLLNTQLVEHPLNMRRIYRLDDVRKMALSQLSRSSAGKPPCTQPLIVTPGPGIEHYDSKSHHKLTVIAGHLRLRGNRYLEGQAPRLNCVLRFYATEADMLADMSTENGIRADPGPVSWALHFRTLLSQGIDIRQVARDSGKSVSTVRGLLKLLELSDEAQTIIDEGWLPVGAADHLLRIKDDRLQARVARKFAKKKTPLCQMDIVIDHLLAPQVPSRYASKTSYKAGSRVPRRIEPEELQRMADTPAAPALVGIPEQLLATLGDLRAAAAITCRQCPISAEHGQPEAAWHLARAAAGEVCAGCNMRLVKNACNACPLPMMLSRVTRQVRGERPRAAGAVVALAGVNA